MFSSLISHLPSISNAFDRASQAILTPEPILHKDFGAALSDSLDAVALNPQPLPPKAIAGLFDHDAVALNPQPLPPKEVAGLFDHDAVALNPQPLPPADTPFWSDAAGMDPAFDPVFADRPAGPDWPEPVAETMSDELDPMLPESDFDGEPAEHPDFDVDATFRPIDPVVPELVF